MCKNCGTPPTKWRKPKPRKNGAKEKAPENAEEVWKRGYGSGGDLTWLFLALARAAGLEANAVWVSDREHYFFNPSLMQSDRLDLNLVTVKLNGKTVFCDPGSAYTPMGLLPWMETGVRGLQLDKNGGAWIDVLQPRPRRLAPNARPICA